TINRLGVLEADFGPAAAGPSFLIARRPPRIAGLGRRTLGFQKQTTRINIQIEPDILAMLGGRRLEDQVLGMLRDQLADLILGTIFLFMGLAACGIAAMRRRSGVRVLIRFGLWSAMYGGVELIESPAVVAVSPRWLQISFPYLDVFTQYFILVVAWLAFLEL